MQDEAVITKFRESGALMTGHFVLSSGLHSRVYLQCAIALQSPVVAAEFGAAIAERFQNDRIETVASPALGGLIIGYEVARHLGARFIWTERANGEMTLRRGFSVRAGERVLVVEDVVTTGGSTRETIEVLSSSGATIVAAASIIDRSGGRAEIGVPRFSLAMIDVPAVAPADCDACKRGEPILKPGSRTTVGSGQ
jgi:orotate phosphoribosyltransferase